MKMVDPQAGQVRIEKRRRRYHELGQPRELTFSCYRHYPFLLRERAREWFREGLQAAPAEFGFQIWAYVPRGRFNPSANAVVQDFGYNAL